MEGFTVRCLIILSLLLGTIGLRAAVMPVALSRAATTSETPSGDSAVMDMSADGGLVLILSTAPNIVHGDNQRWDLDLFVLNRTNGQSQLITKSISGPGGGNGSALNAMFARNPRWIAFESEASDLVPNDTNGVTDVFLHDRASQTTILVSKAANPALIPADSTLNGISADAKYIFFESFSDAVLGQVNTNLFSQVFRFDQETGLIDRVTVGVGRRADLNYAAEPSWSADGQQVAFVASDLNSTTPPPADIYLRDMNSSQVTRISAAVGDMVRALTATNEVVDCGGPVIFGDGSMIVFHASGTQTWRSFLVKWTRATGALEILTEMDPALRSGSELGPVVSPQGGIAYAQEGNIHLAEPGQPSRLISETADGEASSGSAVFPTFSADGAHLFFLSDAADLHDRATNETHQIYRAELSTGAIELVSADNEGVPIEDEGLQAPVVSDDGNLAAFESLASHLVPSDLDGGLDVFLRDMTTDNLEVLTRAAAGLENSMGNGPTVARERSVSHDGSRVLLLTEASNLLTNLSNAGRDLVVVDLPAGQKRLLSPGGNVPDASHLSLAKLSADGQRVSFVRSEISGGESVILVDLPTGSQTVVYATNSTRPGVTYQADADLKTFAVSVPEGPPFIRNTLLTVDNGVVSPRTETSGRGIPWSLSPNGQHFGRSERINPLQFEVQLTVEEIATSTTNLVLPLGTRMPDRVVVTSRGDALIWVRNEWLFAQPGKAPITLLAAGGVHPTVSDSGNVLAFPASLLPVKTIRTLNLDTGLTKDFTLPSTQADATFTSFALSPDGQHLAARWAPRQSEEELSALMIYNLLDGSSERLAEGEPGMGNSLAVPPAFSGDSRTFVFNTTTQLEANDFNRALDAHAITLPAGDADNDYLPDAWELAQFGGLTAGGMEDSDNDGVSNAAEHWAGSDPKNPNSLFQVTASASSGLEHVRLQWVASGGRSYEIQSTGNLGAGQWDTESLVTSHESGPMEALMPVSAEAQGRYFRVILR